MPVTAFKIIWCPVTGTNCTSVGCLNGIYSSWILQHHSIESKTTITSGFILK